MKFDNSMSYSESVSANKNAPAKQPKHYEIAQQVVGVAVEIVGDENVVVATAAFSEFQGIGTSRRASGDQRDMMLGINLAVQRALERLTERLKEHNSEIIQRAVVEHHDAIEEWNRRAAITEARLEKEAFNLRYPDVREARRQKAVMRRAGGDRQSVTVAEEHGTIVLTIGE